MTVKHIQRVYYLILGLFWFATALPMALMVLLIQSRGMHLFQIGILMGLYSATIVLLEVPTGGLADAIGRKRVALMAYSFMMVSSLVFLISFSFFSFLLAWILAGVGRALSSGSLDAWFVDELQGADPDIDIQPPLAKAGTISLLALGMGTLFGGLIPRLFSGLPAEGSAVLTPFSMTVVVASIVTVLLLLAVIFLVHESEPKEGKGDWKQGFHQVPAVIQDSVALSRKSHPLLLLLAVTLVSGLALASIETFWSPRFAMILGGSEGNSLIFALAMSGAFIFGMVGNMVSIPLSRLLNQRYALVAAIFQGGQGLLLILLALQSGIAPAFAFFWLVYLSRGVLGSPHETLVNQEIPAERRSSMLSIQSLASYVGGIIGSIVLGYLANTWSISLAWIVSGVVLLVSLFLYLQVDQRRVNREEEHEPETAFLKAN